MTDPSSTSKIYRVPGHLGTVGFITSMSNHFCGGCNRLRLTADGNLKICLFDNREVNLLHMIQNKMTDSEILDEIKSHLMKKHFTHGGLDAI